MASRLLGGLSLFCCGPLYAHIADEIALKTTVELREEAIGFRFDIASGVLFSTVFLKTLDPDRNKTFEEDHIRNFSDFFLQSLSIQCQGETKTPVLSHFSASAWDFFAAGVSTLVLEYTLPREKAPDSVQDLRYELSFYPQVAVYSLSVINRVPGELAVLEERRNEYLQDILELRYTADPIVVAETAQRAAAKTLAAGPGPEATQREPDPLILKGGMALLTAPFLLQGQTLGLHSLWGLMAVAVGFLHAFTPGHGKALVGAFLIANQGTVLHALFLGLILTLTHTISIYAFGLLASGAAQVFLPGEFVPVLTLLCGLSITGIGLRSLVKRLRGTGAYHAHLLPNLRVLVPDQVNILIDGTAAAANEALLIASDDQDLQQSLKAAGAQDFNLCSPGCSAHTRLPRVLREHEQAVVFTQAIKTGAVDAVVTASNTSLRHIRRLRERTWAAGCDAVTEAPRELLMRAIGNYARRGPQALPEDRLSWGRVVSLGITGGIIPCPDALAILLMALAAGKATLGLGLVFLFSVGLAFALILLGFIILCTRRLLQGQRSLGFITASLPYISSLFITGLGLLMIVTMLKNLFRLS
jgi:ABC-type nickel/cobalt efflux system permease component RcnA